MRRSRPLTSCLALVLALGGCRDAGRRLTHRGFTPGMTSARFRQAAESIGPLECGEFGVEGVHARQLCAASSPPRQLRVAGAVDSGSAPVPYIVIQEADSGGRGFAALTREWGAPDTLVDTGRRWRRGEWIADADTLAGRLTIWLTDTATEVRIARHSVALRRAALDTLPVRNEMSAVLDTIRLTSPAGAALPAAASEVSQRPRVMSCTNSAPPPALVSRRGAVTLFYVVDTAGHAEPASIRVLEATHGGLVAPAVATIRSCTFRPGRQAGQPVRVLVRQQVGFSPR